MNATSVRVELLWDTYIHVDCEIVDTYFVIIAFIN